MMLCAHDDPNAAADFALCDLEEQLRALDAIPAEVMAHYADRAEDLADQLHRIAANSPRKEL